MLVKINLNISLTEKLNKQIQSRRSTISKKKENKIKLLDAEQKILENNFNEAKLFRDNAILLLNKNQNEIKTLMQTKF